jgi:hypothetical protein
MKYLLCLILLGCSSPKFEMPSSFPCSIPAKAFDVIGENHKGCWRMIGTADHSLTLNDPGPFTCSKGELCTISVPGQSIWAIGSGEGEWLVEDVDCSELCE